MNAKDQGKLLDAGFMLIIGERHHLIGFRIKAKTKDRREWYTYEKGFKSKAELKRRLEKLSEGAKIVDLIDSANTQFNEVVEPVEDEIKDFSVPKGAPFDEEFHNLDRVS